MCILSVCCLGELVCCFCCFFFQAEDGIRDHCVTGVQTCALPICFRKSLDADLAARIDRLGAEVIQIETVSADEVGAADIESLRQALRTREADAVVWVSYVAAMTFAFASRSAPVTMWWGMK